MKLVQLVSAGMPALIEKRGKRPNKYQRQALQAIVDCRTGALGSTLMCCPDCNHQQLRHRSCGHRSCPQCQHHSNSAWLQRQQARLLPVNYFMVTFTLPRQLRSLAYANPKDTYAAMFDVVISTLNSFAKNHPQLKDQPVICAMLHTHSRQLDYHPHVHLIVPGCVIDSSKKQWRKLKGDYLFNGSQLAKVFRARMLEAISQLHLTMPDNLPGRWNAQCKDIGKGLPALKYLSRYLYRGVTSENDLIHFNRDRKQVTFRYRDSKSGRYRHRCLPLDDFLWRIMMQVLPKGLRRVRDYGFLQGDSKTRLILLQLLLHVSIPPTTIKLTPPYQCVVCHADMRIVGFLKPRRIEAWLPETPP